MKTYLTLIGAGAAAGIAVGIVFQFTDILGPNPGRYPALLKIVSPASHAEMRASPEMPETIAALSAQLLEKSEAECRAKRNIDDSAYAKAARDLVTQATALVSGPATSERSILRATAAVAKESALDLATMETDAEHPESLGRAQQARLNQVHYLYMMLRDNLRARFHYEGVRLASIGMDMKTVFEQGYTIPPMSLLAGKAPQTAYERQLLSLDMLRLGTPGKLLMAGPPRSFEKAIEKLRSDVAEYIEKLRIPVDARMAEEARKPTSIPRVNTN